MKKIIIPIIILSAPGLLHAQASAAENYVQSTTYLDYPSGQNAKTAVSVQYFDGLGRPKQTVNVKASPLGRDVVSHVVYDPFGRVANEYLPVPQGGTAGGAIYTDPLSYAPNTPYGNERIYTEKLLENSPLDRVLEQKQQGTAWDDKPVKFEYGTNTDTEVKKYMITTSWSQGVTSFSVAAPVQYPAGQLYKTVTTDEDGNKTTEFKNTQGQVVLVRKAVTDSQDADTYYVYNEYDQLALVIPPMAVSAAIDANTLDHYCYQYRYDGRNRLAEKKIPGKGWEYIVYDRQDRPVMTQDAELGKSRKWMFTKYDLLGRAVYTGIYTGTQDYGSAGRASEQAMVDTRGSNNESRGSSSPDSTVAALNYNNAAYPDSGIRILTINYYDTFPRDPYFPGNLPDTVLDQKVIVNTQEGNAKGLLLATYLKNMEDDSWTRNFMLYDTKGRMIGIRSANHLGGSTNTDMKLNFTGLTVQSITRHKRLGTDTEKVITENFTFDHQNRPLVHKHKVDNNPKEILTQNTYNELSQLQSKKVGGTDPAQPLQTIDYQYNIRGWMTKINDPKNLGGKLFGYEIKYNSVEGEQTPDPSDYALKVLPRYNGNIAEVDWRTSTVSGDHLRRYGYVYDKLNRLSAGFYQKDSNPSAREYYEKVSYDLNGNIMTLKRSAEAQGTSAFNIDELTYVYENSNKSNRLLSVTDSSTDYRGYPDTSGSIIPYDDNGNMLSQKDKGILQIDYNFLNLPKYIKFDKGLPNRSGRIYENTNYLYRADGTKLRKIFNYAPPNPFGTVTELSSKITEYLDGFQYESTITGKKGSTVLALKFVPTAEGYYNFENNKYIYNYTDHLGNVRLSYFHNGSSIEVLEENNYYPFGLKHEGYNPTAGNPAYQRKYNGKELQTESGMYDYGARFYMPDIGRWGVVDPLAEMNRAWSPYRYAYNNPIRFIDSDGRLEGDFISEDGKYLGNDGINDGKVYVVKTTQTSFDNGATPAGITKGAAKATESFIRANSGNTSAFQSNNIAYDNSVEIIGNPETRESMVDIVNKDNGKGGTSDANNREYGGVVRNDKVIESPMGPVGNPQTDSQASVTHPDVKKSDITFHSHPSGEIIEGSGNKSQTTSGTTLGGSTTTYNWGKAPSSHDISNAKGTGYVFSRSNGTVYIFNKSGVTATIPQKRFVEPKK